MIRSERHGTADYKESDTAKSQLACLFPPWSDVKKVQCLDSRKTASERKEQPVSKREILLCPAPRARRLRAGAFARPGARVVALAIGAALAAAAPSSASDTSADAYIQGLVRALAMPRSEGRAITLADAVVTAVRNNPGIRARANDPAAARLDVLERTGVYDPRIRIDGGFVDTERLTANRIEAGLDVFSLESLEEDQYTLDFAVSKLFRTGTVVDVTWTNRRRTTEAAFQILSPQYDPTLGVSIEQPLLKNFGGLEQRTNVLLARNTSMQEAAAFEAELSTFVVTVAQAYWDYTQAKSELRVREHALKLVEETRRKVEVGSLPPVAAREARADAAAREEELMRAENDLDLAARRLQYLVMAGVESGGAPEPVVPAEQHTVHAFEVARDRSLATAVERRPEVRAARLALAAAELRERAAKNALLPSLDLVGSYTLLGLGGKPVDAGEVESYAEALDRLASGDFFRFAIGVRLEVPLSNAGARARHAREAIAVTRAKDEVRRVVADVALEIERAAGDVESAAKRADAARIARELAEENFANQRKRYEVGMVTTTDVLEFQEDLADAMAAEAAAVADHARALARLRRAEGVLLDSYAIDVGFEDTPSEPWWARF